MKKIKILVVLAIVCVGVFGFQTSQQLENIHSKNLQVEVSEQDATNMLGVNVGVHFNSKLSQMERQMIRNDFQTALGVNFISWSNCLTSPYKEVWIVSLSYQQFFQIAADLGYFAIIDTGSEKQETVAIPEGGLNAVFFFNSNCSEF